MWENTFDSSICFQVIQDVDVNVVVAIKFGFILKYVLFRPLQLQDLQATMKAAKIREVIIPLPHHSSFSRVVYI